MRALVLFNPRSGKGRGEQVAGLVCRTLEARGIAVETMATEKETAEQFAARAAARLKGVELMIVAGGDGTLHRSIPALLNTGVAVYHLAMGTENLFARQFRMDRTVETLDAAVAAGRTMDVDVGTVSINGGPLQPFGVMCSVGPDASIIRKLDAVRTGPITHLTYLGPVATELLRPWLPRVRIEVDGETIEGKGMVVVANSRQYAIRIDPAARASMTDGLLDVVFFPATGAFDIASCILRSRLRRHNDGVVYKQGRRVRVVVEGEAPAYQLDGECGHAPPGTLTLDLAVREKALRVLTP